MYSNTSIIHEMRTNSIIKRSEYIKNGQVVKVLYYNNGLVTESVGSTVTSKPISEEEKQHIVEHYDKLKKSLKKLRETDEEITRKAKEDRRLLESCRY